MQDIQLLLDARHMSGVRRSRFFDRRGPFGSGPLRFPVAIGEGSHPFPCRTRPLSPLPPMVLHGKPCGRVGHCRDFSPTPGVA